MTITQIVRTAMARTPDITVREIAAETGLTYNQVWDARSRILNPDMHKNRSAKWHQDRPYYRTELARSKGVRPIAEVRAEQKRVAQQHAMPVLKAKRKGGSYSDVGKKLGLTRNAVAGRLWRAKQREKVASEANQVA